MNILPINNTQQNKPHFKKLIIHDSAQKIINKMNLAEQAEVKALSKELAKLKHWDLLLEGCLKDKFYCEFISKQNPKDVHTMGFRADKVDGNALRIKSVGIFFSKKQWIQFPTAAQAQAIKFIERENLKKYVANQSPLERLKIWAQKITFLDEAYSYMYRDFPEGKQPKDHIFKNLNRQTNKSN